MSVERPENKAAIREIFLKALEMQSPSEREAYLQGACGSDAALRARVDALLDSTLYGTASSGGSSGNGTVFKVNIDGTGFTTLHSFSGGRDGASPLASLILSSNTLYGTASGGGDLGDGTVLSISLPVTPPQRTVSPSGAYVILAWPTNASGFSLQSTTNLVSPAAWTTVSPEPVVLNGQNTVTNPVSGTQQFYRLSR